MRLPCCNANWNCNSLTGAAPLVALSNADNCSSMSFHVWTFSPVELAASSCIRACKCSRAGSRFSGESCIAAVACSFISAQFPARANILARAKRPSEKLGLSETRVRNWRRADSTSPILERADANAKRICGDLLPNSIDRCQHLTASYVCPLLLATRPSK